MVEDPHVRAVDDVGTVVNPMIVEGQVHGGLAQGIAQALYEEAVYDADGNLITGTLVDYLVPVGRRPAALRHRPHGAPGDQQPARRQGRRRGRHHRLHAGRGQRRRWTRSGTSGCATSGCRCTPERVWRAIHQGGDGGDRATAGTNAYGGARPRPPPASTADASSLGGDR